jgi:hypothetical protein
MITPMHSYQIASPPGVEVDRVGPAASPLADRREDPAGRRDDAARMSVSYVARRAGVAPSLLFNWRGPG